MTLPKGFSAEEREAQRKKNDEEDAQRKKNAKFEKKIFFIFFIFYFLVLLPPLIAPYLNSQPSILPSSIVVVCGIAIIFVVYQLRKSIKDTSPPKRETTGSLCTGRNLRNSSQLCNNRSNSSIFRSSNFTNAVIRSPIELFALLTNYNYFSTFFLVLTFFSMAGTSYLGTTFFLSHIAEQQKEKVESDLQALPRLYKRKEPEKPYGPRTTAIIAGTRGLFFTFILSFLQGTFLLLMAISINSSETLSTPEIFSRFVLWLFLLEIIDTIWIMLTILVRTSGFKNSSSLPPPYEWVLLNTLMMVFLLVYFLYPITITWDVYIALSIVFLARTLADFRVGWKSVYGPVILQT